MWEVNERASKWNEQVYRVSDAIERTERATEWPVEIAIVTCKETSSVSSHFSASAREYKKTLPLIKNVIGVFVYLYIPSVCLYGGVCMWSPIKRDERLCVCLYFSFLRLCMVIYPFISIDWWDLIWLDWIGLDDPPGALYWSSNLLALFLFRFFSFF